MKVLITGICGFVGCRLAEWFCQHRPGWTITGVDNLSRAGSELNRSKLATWGVKFQHADIRHISDLDPVGHVDWVIDAAALPSVLTGVTDGASYHLMENNLFGTVNVLEFCRKQQAGLILLSTSRVYSIKPLADLPVAVADQAYVPRFEQFELHGISPEGISEAFSTTPPLSLYGSSKLASEILAMEYSAAFGFPLQINRCGVMAGAGQFGHPGQGVFSYWIHAHRSRHPMRFCGFDGKGYQVRDILHPWDLARLVTRQMEASRNSSSPILANVSGGLDSAISLRQLTDWCDDRFGSHGVESAPLPRPYDLPWVVLDSSLSKTIWNWSPDWSLEAILNEIADFAEQFPNWLELSQ